ncbi:MAG: nicotinate-nucleotide adenylyltransferase [Crocinitomicaceae bacterium]|jgi:nicotinate-nucleotide adenylyltransferase|nr:nicotinate-nucleotide adenylyltransferase [Crocinitomicaceae bacterium]MDG2331564.1 nicotinate (nicotinamide) nucleotide adenylyltransferase [Flavobacteriales bacterium]
MQTRIKKNKNIGLFFGSFNPIHVGHLIIANHMAQQDLIDEVWLVVSPHNPHKKKDSLLSDLNRFYMVNLAIEDNQKLRASNIEFKLPQPSYTVDTLTYIQEKYPEFHFSIIMGEDNMRSFHKWKNYEDIISNYNVFVYPRNLTDQEAKERPIENHFLEHEKFHFVDIPVMKIEASHIRNLIKEGKDTRYLLTEPVAKYCEEMGFYK